MGEHADEQAFGLVMPFVCVTSVGGPYDDQSFVAGVRVEQIRWELKARPKTFGIWVEPALTTQLDLVAMEAGYTVKFGPWDNDSAEWVKAEFSRIETDHLLGSEAES